MKIENFYDELINFLSILLELKEKPNLIIGKNEKIYYNPNNIDFEYKEVNARFYTENNILYVNLDKHNEKTHDEIFSVIHEFRHFYQLKQIENNINTELVKKWKSNFDNYLQFGEDGYYSQEVEIDANAFTVYIVQCLFRKKCYVSLKFDQNKIDYYIELYVIEYNTEKIRKILKEMNFNVECLFKVKY